MAACAPTFVTGPIVGALADKYGAEWIITPCLLFSTLWFPFLILTGSLAGFVMFFALATVFLSCALTPVGLEVAMVARDIEGMSEIHQFAAMNIAFSTSTAIGAIVGGQMYNSSSAGWSAVIWRISPAVVTEAIAHAGWAGSPSHAAQSLCLSRSSSLAIRPCSGE